MLQREKVGHFQFSVSALLLDIQNYINGDDSFHYQNYGKKIYYGDNYDFKKSDQRFISVIESVKTKGFDTEKRIEILPDVSLKDGNHRVSLAIWGGRIYDYLPLSETLQGVYIP